MRTVLTLFVMLFVVGSALLPEPARAGPDDDRKAAEKLIGEGLTLARAKKFREAIEKFEDALKLYPHPETQHNLARAHEELGELKTAWEYFTQALKHDYTYAADARTRIAKIETELRKSYARLTVRTTPSQVSVLLQFPDGQEETHVQTPFATWAKAGTTKLTGTNPNFKTREETVELAAGEDRELALVVQPLPRQGFFQISVNIAGATISLAGQPIGKSPLASLPWEAGVYQLEVRAKGHKPHVQEVIIVQDEVTSVNVSLEADVNGKGKEEDGGGVPAWVGWTLVGTGVVAGGVAAYLQFGKAKPTQEEANRLPQVPEGDPDKEYQRLHQKAVDYQTGAAITVAIGAVAAGIGTYLLIFEGGDEPPAEGETTSAPRFVPTVAVTPDGAAVGGVLRF